MRVGTDIAATLPYVQRIVEGELNALFAGGGINGSYIDQVTFLLISVVKKQTNEGRMSLFSTLKPDLKSLKLCSSIKSEVAKGCVVKDCLGLIHA
jgi:hypothetical protein